MIGSKLAAAALLLPLSVSAIPRDLDIYGKAMLKDLRVHRANMDYAFTIACTTNRMRPIYREPICASIADISIESNAVMTALFCSQYRCGAKYDPSTGLCQCSLNPPTEMDEIVIWPEKACKETTICHAPLEAHWNPLIAECTCAMQVFPKIGAPLVFHPAVFNNHLKSSTQQLLIQKSKLLTVRVSALHKMMKTIAAKGDLVLSRREASGAVSLAPLPTYIPPPNSEVTQELLQESLLIQPQQVATVGSVIPQFADGVITFLVQLDGPISQTLALNATDTLPCETIGVQPQPHLVLVPKAVKNGTTETVLPTCLIIAVNMYEPKYITYWVQKEDGSVFSLLSDNKIHAIDQLDTSQPASIAIRVAPIDNSMRRDIKPEVDVAIVLRRQIFSVACENPCPFYHMERLKGSDGYCGCMFKSAEQTLEITARGVETPSPYTATMTAKACAAMSCLNNGGKAALFNPFTATCWCSSPAYVEVNENAYESGV